MSAPWVGEGEFADYTLIKKAELADLYDRLADAGYADGIRLAEAVKEVVAHERGSIEEAWQYGDRMLARAKKAEAEIARLRSFGDGR